MSPWDHLHVIGPAFALFVGAGVVLTADLIVDRRAPVRSLTLLALAAAFGYALWHAFTGTEGAAFDGAVVMDRFALYFAFLLIAITAAVAIAASEFAQRIEHGSEFYALLLVSAGSMVLLAQGNDLIAVFVALETTSISQFVLAGMGRDQRSSEAGLKYLLTGAVAAAVLLYGFAFLFGLAGTTSLSGIAEYVNSGDEGTRLALIMAFVLVAAGLGFKLAITPFQAWVPDVYQGAPTPVTTFLAVASKAAGFAIALRIFYVGLGGAGTFISNDWAALFAVLAGASMTFGNAAAILQTDVKRLLGYSSIAQAGNIAVGLAAVAAGSTIGPSGVLFFLGTYAATNLGAFIAVIAVGERIGSDDIRDYAGLLRTLAVAGLGARAVPALAHRHPAHRRLPGEGVHLQRSDPGATAVAGLARRRGGAQYRGLRLLLPALGAHDRARRAHRRDPGHRHGAGAGAARARRRGSALLRARARAADLGRAARRRGAPVSLREPSAPSPAGSSLHSTVPAG